MKGFDFMNIKKFIITANMFILAAAGCVSGSFFNNEIKAEAAAIPSVKHPITSTGYRNKVVVKWGNIYNSKVDGYLVQKRRLGTQKWYNVKYVSRKTNTVTDNLTYRACKCFEYRIICKKHGKFSGKNDGTGVKKGRAAVTVCIDPGHLGTSNNLAGSNLPAYSESKTMYSLGASLNQKLKKYGIKTVVTRRNVNTLTNGVSGNANDNLFYRGQCAKNCDFFISLHSNVNGNYLSLSNKERAKNNAVLSFPNNAAYTTSRGKCISLNVSKAAAKAMGSTGAKPFVNKYEYIRSDSDTDKKFQAYNNSFSRPSCFCRKQLSNNQAYYGVIRSADTVGVPGILLEHSYHTNPNVIDFFNEESNIEKLAKAEAEAFARSFGYIK